MHARVCLLYVSSKDQYFGLVFKDIRIPHVREILAICMIKEANEVF